MRTRFLSLILFLSVTSGYNQTWQVLPNSPVGGYWNHDDIAFVNEQTGWLCDISGQIYKTSDGGDNWVPVTNLPTDNPMRGICGMRVITSDIIYGVGRYDGPAVFLKTMDGGATWTSIAVPGAESLVDLHFFDPDTAWWKIIPATLTGPT